MRNKEKRPQMQKNKVLFHQDNAPCRNSMKPIIKLNKLRLKLLSYPPYRPDQAASDYWLFADFKRMLQGKRFDSKEEAIAEAEAYFERNDKSFYEKGIKRLKECWVECITLEGEFLDK